MLTFVMKTTIKFTVFLLILIAASGFAQTSESIPSSLREFKIEKRYLNIPIKNGSIYKRGVSTLVDGKVEPSRSTVQAPHWPSPHPYLAPVSERWSRSTVSKGISGSASMGRRVPFTVSWVTVGIRLLWH